MNRYHEAKEEVLRDFEFRWLLKMYLLFDGDISKMAKGGKVDRGTIYRMMKRCDITQDDLAERVRPEAGFK